MKDVRERLARLGAGSVGLVGGGSGGTPEFSGAELAGIMSGMSEHARDLALWRYCGDESVRPAIFYVAYVRVAKIAADGNWRLPPAEMDAEGKKVLPMVLRRMTAAALFEIVELPVCEGCGGTGWLRRAVSRASNEVCECPQCGGRGRRRLSGVSVAKALGRGHSQFHEVWKRRYEAVYTDLWGWVNGLESDIGAVLRRQMRGG